MYLHILVLWLFGLVLAFPSTNTSGRTSTVSHPDLSLSNITKQFDICSGTSGTLPVLYYNYTSDQCTPNLHLADDGVNCYVQQWANTGGKYFSEDCAAYCQLATIFTYALEWPFPSSYCNYPMECSITRTHSTSWNWGISLSPKVGKWVKVGISGSWGHTWGTSTGQSFKITLQQNECGYFSFIPIAKKVQIYTESVHHTTWGGSHCDTDYTSSVVDVPMVWNVEQWDGSWGPDGSVIFVFTDCKTRMPLPIDFQNPIYNNPGVALDRGVSSNMLNEWSNNTCSYTANAVPWNTPGLVDYTVIIYGVGMSYGEIGLNGSLLVDSIVSRCDSALIDLDTNNTLPVYTNRTVPYSFAWYQWNGTRIVPDLPQTNLGPIIQPNGWQLELNSNSSRLPGANFGLALTLTLNSSTFTPFCFGDAVVMAGGSTYDQCDGPPPNRAYPTRA